MIKLRYTLIELLAAMTIFIIMMGILFRTFSASAEVASAQTIKVNILSDANLFFNYLTNDFKNIDILSIDKLLDKDNAAIDPNNGNTTNEASGNKLHFTSTSISFYSDVKPYDDNEATSYSTFTDPSPPNDQTTLLEGLDINADLIPDLKPYLAYELVTYTENGISKKAIVRKMYFDQELYVSDAGVYSGLTSSADMLDVDKCIPVILEGVESLDIKVWDDYPGGTEVTTSPIGIAPACITVSVTLTDPSPYVADAVKTRNQRQITKVIYINR